MLTLTCIANNNIKAQNVGIGTPTPEEKLHVVNTVDAADGASGAFINVQNSSLTAPNGILSGIRFRLDGISAGANARYKGGIFFERTGTFGTGKLHLLTNSLANNNSVTTADARMTINTDGKVGINNTNPTRGQLEINSANNTSQFVTSTGTAGVSFSVPLSLSPTIAFNMYYANAFRYMTTGYGASIQYSPSSGTLFFNTSQTSGAPDAVAFMNGSSVIIDSNGYMGIGTTVPKAKLHVNSSMVIGASTTLPATGYLLSVNGKIISEEVRVQLDADWPDYVFENTYRLKPLSEVERFIANHKHLPDIPSAKEVAKDGILLGDMQKKMMEKMEELTLYVIQLDKENQQLRREIADIRQLVEKK